MNIQANHSHMKQMTNPRGALSSAPSIMDLSTNLEQSHVKQRLARFYEQSATESNLHHHMRMTHESANQMSLATNSNNEQHNSSSSSSSSNTHNNSRFTTVLTSTGRASSGDSGLCNSWTGELKNHSLSQASNHTQNHTVSTIMSSGGGRRGSGESEGHNSMHHSMHHSISQMQCTSLPSPPPPAESPGGSSSSLSGGSSISSPYSRQMDMEGSMNGYTNIMSRQSSGKKRKRRPQPIPENCKDDAYWERRKRNNESAKRSRELRRRKEQQTTMRVIYLEQDNLKLKTEVDMLRTEVEKLQEMLFARNGNSFH